MTEFFGACRSLLTRILLLQTQLWSPQSIYYTLAIPYPVADWHATARSFYHRTSKKSCRCYGSLYNGKISDRNGAIEVRMTVGCSQHVF